MGIPNLEGLFYIKMAPCRPMQPNLIYIASNRWMNDEDTSLYEIRNLNATYIINLNKILFHFKFS